MIPIRELERWLEDRRGSIGGSEAAAIFGQSNWDTPLSVYLKKRGLVESEPPTTRLRAGLAAEPMISQFAQTYLEQESPDRYSVVTDADEMRSMLKKHAEFVGVKLQFQTYGEGEDAILLVRRADFPRAHATPDGLLYDRTDGTLFVYEAKTVSEYMKEDWYTTDLPPYYRTQAHHNASVLALPGTFVAALVGWGKEEYRFVDSPDDPEGNLGILSAWFDRHVLGGEEPKASAADTAVLRTLFPNAAEGKKIDAIGLKDELLDELVQLDERYEKVIAEKKAATEAYEGIRNRVRQVMADSTELYLPSGVVWTHRQGKKSRTLNRKKTR